MKRNKIITFGWLTGLAITCFCSAKAQDAVPCLIFTGNSDTQYSIDLDKLNRITFEDEGMTISSSKESNEPEVKLLYTLFNHIEIGDSTPTDPAAVEEVEGNGNTRLSFKADTKSLFLESTSERPYSIGIFSLKGTLIATSTMTAGQSLSVDALSAGTYIAVATNGESKHTIKFIL